MLLRGNLIRLIYAFAALILAGAASGCMQPAAASLVTASATAPAPTPSAALTSQPLPPPPTITPSPAPVEPLLWIDPAVPESAREGFQFPAGLRQTGDPRKANLRLEPAGTAPGMRTARWTYALVAPFPALIDNLSFDDLQSGWRGEPADFLNGQPILLDAETRVALEALLGKPGPRSTRVVSAGELLQQAWKAPYSLAIVPFEAIEPRWKVLRIDGISPLDRDAEERGYALQARFGLRGTPEGEAAARALPGWSAVDAPANRDPGKLTVLAMTGVTALSRYIAIRMEEKGITYPALKIAPWLVEADLTHISNEVSFYTACPKPGPERVDMRFCSSPRYIELLEYVGTDIVELTGNHNLDWGAQPFLDTLEMYRERGWMTYGGGANRKEALAPLALTHNGNRLAFLGCSPAGPAAVWAGEYTPGSAPCNLDQLEQQVRALRAEGYLPVVTFQHVETDGYTPAIAQGAPDFRRMARAGAAVVSGSQSHYPQTMTLVESESGGTGFVHYGLGNLFFDQMEPEALRAAFVDRHVFYDGRYLGVELLTSLLEDSAQPRPMRVEERLDFLGIIFSLSDWSGN